MKKLVFAAIFTVLAFPACAVTTRVLNPSQTRQHLGEWIEVGGQAQIRPDPQIPGMDVNLVDHDGRVLFLGFIPRLNEGQFPHLAAYDGKQVILNGVMEFYRAYPAIQLVTSGQLRLSS